MLKIIKIEIKKIKCDGKFLRARGKEYEYNYSIKATLMKKDLTYLRSDDTLRVHPAGYKLILYNKHNTQPSIHPSNTKEQ